MSELVLVTGAGGYLATHVINEFAKNGYRVRGTVRSLKDEKRVEPIRNITKNAKHQIELVEADLLVKDSWANAMKGVTIVIHVASPFPNSVPTDENEVIKPALEGTLNVLNAAFEAGVKRVVVTSSVIAISGRNQTDRLFSENDWADVAQSSPYGKSKVLAEKAAWDFVAEKKKNNQPVFELAVVNPSFILGPTLHGGSTIIGTSERTIIDLVEGNIPKVNNYSVGICDVRDVALAHYKAAFSQEAVGHRHAILSEQKYVAMKRIADILHDEFSPKGYKVTHETDNVSDNNTRCDNTRMTKVLGVNPTDLKKTVIDMANSLIEAGLIRLPK